MAGIKDDPVKGKRWLELFLKKRSSTLTPEEQAEYDALEAERDAGVQASARALNSKMQASGNTSLRGILGRKIDAAKPNAGVEKLSIRRMRQKAAAEGLGAAFMPGGQSSGGLQPGQMLGQTTTPQTTPTGLGSAFTPGGGRPALQPGQMLGSPSTRNTTPAGAATGNLSGGRGGVGPFALEQTTQLRLIEIRDTIRILASLTGQVHQQSQAAPPPAATRQSVPKTSPPQKVRGPRAQFYQGLQSDPEQWQGAFAGASERGAQSGAHKGERVGAVFGARGAEGGAKLGAAIGKVLGPIGALGDAASSAGKAVVNFAHKQEQVIRRLGDVGAMQAAGIARLDAERTMRDVKTAGETGETSQAFTEALSKFEEAIQPIVSLLTNIFNAIGTGILLVLSDILELIRPLVELLQAIFNKIFGVSGPGRKEPETTWKFMEQIEKENKEQAQPKWPAGATGNRGVM